VITTVDIIYSTFDIISFFCVACGCNNNVRRTASETRFSAAVRKWRMRPILLLLMLLLWHPRTWAILWQQQQQQWFVPIALLIRRRPSIPEITRQRGRSADLLPNGLPRTCCEEEEEEEKKEEQQQKQHHTQNCL
jgi:hypothetical protein